MILFLFIFIVVSATYYKYVDVIRAGSVEIRGLKLEQVPVRNNGQKDPNLEFYTFQPYVSDKVSYLSIIHIFPYKNIAILV